MMRGAALGLLLVWLVHASDYLDISIRPLERVPSGQRTFSQIELVNLHPTEHVVIHSIQTTPEDVSVNGQPVTALLPQQVHVTSQLLSLGPSQYARIPLTFAPRFPETTDTNYRSNHNISPQPDLYVTKTEILFETSRGVIQHHFQATALNQNEHNLPDHITLGETYTAACRSPPPSLPYCYDVFATGELHVHQLIVSDPSKASVAYMHDDAPILDTTNDEESTPEWESAEQKHALQFTLDGQSPMYVPGDGEQYYLATVCARAVAPDPTVEPIPDPYEPRGLGFLYIQTENDVFFIDLLEAQQTEFGPIEPNSMMAAHPEHVMLYFLDSNHTQTTVIVDNVGNETFRLMQASLLFTDDLAMDSRFVASIQLLDFDDPIDPGESSEALWLEVTVEEELIKEFIEQNLELKGRFRLQATTSNLTYDEWDEMGRMNNINEDELMLEIPLTIRFFSGDVGLAIADTTHPFPYFWAFENLGDFNRITGAFFPLTKGDVGSIVKGDPEVLALDSMDHYFVAHTDLGDEIELNEAKIVDELGYEVLANSSSLCSRFETQEMFHHEYEIPDIEGRESFDVRVRYKFETENTKNRTAEVYPTVCYLRLSTYPDTGFHMTPLVIYPGIVEITSNPLGNGDSDGRKSKLWSEAVVGFERMVEWFRTAKAGLALRKLLDPSLSTLKPSERDPIALGQYLYSLSRKSVDLQRSRLRPVLLRVGAIEQGETETLSLYLTNHNPVPTLITVDVGEVEGMSIHIGRDPSSNRGDGNNILDHLPQSTIRSLLENGGVDENPTASRGPNEKHPLNGMRRFLMNDDIVSTFFSKFLYRDAVSLCEESAKRYPFISDLYRDEALAHFHVSSLPDRFGPGAWTRCNDTSHPARYGEFSDDFDGKRPRGPIIVSSDADRYRRLDTCWDKDHLPEGVVADGADITVPPGGTVRFDIQIRAPKEELLKKDITEFLATGLVLSTNHQEVIPIIVSFEALLGTLDVNHIPLRRVDSGYEGRIEEKSHIRLTPRFFGSIAHEQKASILIPHKSSRVESKIVTRNITDASDNGGGVALYMRSTFDRKVILRSIESCNPLFKVQLVSGERERDIDPFHGLEVGSLESSIPCDLGSDSENITDAFPSFYRCGLNWLHRRNQFQPRGCGESITKNQTLRYNVRYAVDKAQEAFEAAMNYTESFYNRKNEVYASHELLDTEKTGQRSKRAVVSTALTKVLAEAWFSWNMLSELGLNTPSANLRAVVEYNATRLERSMLSFAGKASTEETSFLTYSLRNLTIDTDFDIPQLFDDSDLSGEEVATDPRKGSAPILLFPPTRLAELSSVYIPVRNPTSVPVKVRLAVHELPSERRRVMQRSLSDPESIVGWYLQDVVHPPFVQGTAVAKGNLRMQSSRLWWEFGGEYFLDDLQGNLLRTNGNTTIKSDTSTTVTIAKIACAGGSLFSKKTCGIPCGIHEEKTDAHQGVDEDHGEHLGHIGASAAVGFSYFVVNRLGGDRKWFPKRIDAGSSDRSASDGPSAFAIPFSGLDEIILPPYGRGSLGPVFFRPPGRQPGFKPEMDSSRESFKTLVFLHNSLTGIERLELKGEVKSDEVMFDVTDDKTYDRLLGAIDIIDGEETFQFPKNVYTRGSAMMRSFFIRNIGDSDIEYVKFGLVDAGDRGSTDQIHCSIGSFYTFNCTASSSSQSFVLKAGESRQIIVEYTVDCNKIGERVKMRLWRKPQSSRGIAYGNISDAQHSSLFYPIYDEIVVAGTAFKGENIACTQSTPFVSPRRPIYGWIIVNLVALILLGIAVFSYVSLYSERSFRWKLHEMRTARGVRNADRWKASFQCLDDLYPSTADLSGFGRDQVRHKVLMKYKALGIVPPQCINPTGAFARERPGSLPSRQSTTDGKGATVTSTKARMLSEAIFGEFDSSMLSKKIKLPPGLNWKIALSMGLIREGMELNVVLPSKTLEYKNNQREKEEEDYSSEESSYEDSDVEESEDRSSFHDSSTEDDNAPVEEIESIDKKKALDTKASTFDNDTQQTTTPVLVTEKDETTQKANDKDFIPVQKSKPSAPRGENRQTSPEESNSSVPLQTQTTTTIREERGQEVEADKEEISVATTPSRRANERRETKENEKLKPSPSNRQARDPDSRKLKQRERQEKKKKNDDALLQKIVGKKSTGRTPAKRTKTRKVQTPETVPEQSTTTSPPLRAPPGLAPPPGFEQRGSSVNVLSPSSESGSRPHIIGRAYSNESSILSEALSMSTPDRTIRTPDDSLSQLLGQPTTPQDQIFDIMDFLDGILNDGQPEDLAPPPLNESMLTMNQTALNSNPWASSRAAAYGIDMEDTAGTEDDALNHLPLLTPAAILAQVNDDSKNTSFLDRLLDNDD